MRARGGERVVDSDSGTSVAQYRTPPTPCLPQSALPSGHWLRFNVPIKASSRWELQESLTQSASFNTLLEEGA